MDFSTQHDSTQLHTMPFRIFHLNADHLWRIWYTRQTERYSRTAPVYEHLTLGIAGAGLSTPDGQPGMNLGRQSHIAQVIQLQGLQKNQRFMGTFMQGTSGQNGTDILVKLVRQNHDVQNCTRDCELPRNWCR
jgi:hypothetical protein